MNRSENHAGQGVTETYHFGGLTQTLNFKAILHTILQMIHDDQGWCDVTL